MRSLFILFALLSPLSPAWAAMTAEEFEAFATGQTLTYAENGVIYGMEEYLPNRRVRWAFIGDQCQDGRWYPQGEQICFVYDDAPDDPQCWVFTQDVGRLSAAFAGPDEDRRLYEAARSEEPLICPGPEVGV